MAIFTRRTLLFLALFALGLFRLTIPAHAADFAVTHTGDSGEGSLRQAIIDANAAPGADTISFQAGLTGTITLTDHLPQITDGLMVTGPGISALTIDGGGTYNVFATPVSLPSFQLNVSGLTIVNAVTAIDAQSGSVFLSDMTITGSTSRAVRVSNGYFRTQSVSFIDNTGLATVDLMTNGWNSSIVDSTFSGNVSTNTNAAALRVSLSSGFTRIVNTTFADNLGATAGAIAISGADADLIIDNSTFSGNSATATPGADAIYAIGSSFRVSINFSTFSGHDSTTASDTVGILYVGGHSSYLELTNSIIANNPGSVPGALLECSFDPDRVVVYSSNNLTGDTNCPWQVGVPTKVDPVLADNGGPTRTHALLAGSNAIDRVGCSNIDQRYVDRPQGTSCDLGAFEYVPPPTVVTMSPASQNVVEGANANVTLTRTGDTTSALTVSLDITAGTGTTPSDYTLSGGGISGQSGTVTIEFPAGADTVLLNVAALADAAGAEPDNTLTFSLADGASYDLGTDASAVVTISANDLIVVHTGDTGEGSLRQAITNANTDGVDSTISFAPSADGTITLLSALPSLKANGTLTIEGNGQTNTIISGNDTVRVLYIEASAFVAINNVTITNGYGMVASGIYSLGSLTMVNVIVSNNRSTGIGGGIANMAGDLTLTDSTVSGNITEDSGDSLGGGILNNTGNVLLIRSTVSGNTADLGGGIISGGSVTLIDSAITGNTAIQGGGFYNGSMATATLTNSTVSDNIAEQGGGILSDNGSTLTLNNSTISGNTANGSELDAIDGGGIWNGGTLTINDSTVVGNSTVSVGGGIANGYHGISMLSNTIVSGNTAQGGGGIFNRGTLTVANNSIVTENSAEFIGGGILSYGLDPAAVLYVTDSTISGNNADIDGGGINATGAATVTRSTISGNTAAGNAGGIANGGDMAVIDSLISGNTAAEFGGGIYNVRATLTVTGSTISDNTVGKLDVGGEGGGIANENGTVSLTDSTVSGNSALYGGGGIFNSGLSGESTLTLTGSTVSSNTTGNIGGGILDVGGGILNVDGTLVIVGSTISGNAATRGGAIYNKGSAANLSGGSLIVSSSTITANTASVMADGLLVHGGSVVLNNTILANPAEDCFNEYGTVDANHTLFSNTAACGATEADGNIIGIDPLLGALVTPSDGGPAYYPLLAGSPAIDAGSDALVPDGVTTDQAGNGRIFGAAVDMGSVEFTALNLLMNGSFETAGVTPSKARKWQILGLTTADKRKCDTETKQFSYAGSCAFRFKSPVPVSLARIIRQKIDVTGVESANNALTLSAWVQAKKLTAGAKLKIKIRYADGTTGKAVIKVPTGTYSYTRLNSTLMLTKAAAWVEISVAAGPSSGAILVDDVWLTIAPASTRMGITRGADALLPPPAAPDGFRGSN